MTYSEKHDLGKRNAEAIVMRNHGRFGVPMPAFGESICKIRDKYKKNCNESFAEMDRLINHRFMEIKYLKNPVETFSIARKISSESSDSRNVISPMDSLIMASAIADPDCYSFYTADKKLTSDMKIKDIADQWRKSHGFRTMDIAGIFDILR